MNWPQRIRCCVYAGVCLAPALYAPTAGHISGQVLDSSSAAVAGANIIVESAATGVGRKAITDSNGYYAVADIQIGTYSIRAEKTGFHTAVHEGVRVGIADSLTVNLILSPGDVQDVITVTGKVESGIAVGARLEAGSIADIPINGRDYARLCLLIPGATPRTASMADLPINGLSLVLNSWTVDGVDASRVDVPFLVNGGERGARLLTGSLDTIAEFRVQSANYEAQYGRAASAYVNIASRSGSNERHGNVFSYLRNDFFDARNFFNTRPSAQATFRYSDFGANLGGPIRKNKTFFFANYEGSRQRIGITGSGTTAGALLRARVLAQSPVLASIVAEFPQGTRGTADPLVDLYTAVNVSRVREDTGSIRIDQSLSSRDTIFVRVNINDSHVKGPLFAINPSALGLLDRQDVPVRTGNVAVHTQHIVSSRFLNETLIGMQRVAARYNTATPYPMVSVSALSITPGGGSDQRNISTSYQTGDDMSYIAGVHSLKWGASGYRIQNDIRTSDTSRIFYASLDDFVRNSVSTANLSAGIPGRSVRAYQLGLYLQDSWRVRRNLTMDIGLRYDWDPTIFDPSHLSRPFDTRRQTLAPAGYTFYDDDRLNFGPRFGVGWRPRNRWTVRAGYGIYYEPYPVGYASPTIPLNGLPGTASLLRQQSPTLGYPVADFLAQGASAAPSVTGFRWLHDDTDARQWSLTTAFEATRDLTLQAAYVGNRGLHLRRRSNINLFDPVAKQRPNSYFSDILIEGTDARSDYNSLQLSARQRFHRDFGFGLNYTWSHSIDNAGDENPSSSQPQDIHNVAAERGNGSADVRHIGSFYASYALPFGRDRQTSAGIMSRLVDGWQIASSGILRTGLATTIVIPLSQSGNAATVNQRPDAVRDADPYAPHPSVDRWFNPAAFTLPLPGTFGNLGRNTVFGPGLVQLDVSAIKATRIRDSASLQFRVECFNVLNHPNFAQPNAVFGNASFGKLLNTLGRTLGMGTARQIQLALRLQF